MQETKYDRQTFLQIKSAYAGLRVGQTLHVSSQFADTARVFSVGRTYIHAMTPGGRRLKLRGADILDCWR